VGASKIDLANLNPNKEDNIMPGFDRSSPMGAGPMTGGRKGLCGRADVSVEPVYGRGYGYGRRMGFRRGFGRGPGYGFGPVYGHAYPAVYGAGYPASGTDELEVLRADAEAMQKSLVAVQRRIAELEKKGSE
jgi:hypothetical protein